MPSPPQSSSSNSSTKINSHRRAEGVQNTLSKDGILIQKILIYLLFSFKIAVLLLIIGLFIYFGGNKTQEINAPVAFEVEPGTSVSDIAIKLRQNNIIKNKYRFLWLYYRHKDSLKAGIYLFHPGDETEDVYQKITTGNINEEKFTVIEGWRREQIAQLLHKKGLSNYEAYMSNTNSSEGKLFPDTYRIEINGSITNLINRQLSNFDDKTKPNSPNTDQLIVASLIEREAKFQEDRPLIAGVIYNRLSKNMKLQIDSSVQYARDSQLLANTKIEDVGNFKFWNKLGTGETGEYQSKFNTYLVFGLPPEPISNPGLDSINAAINPQASDYLYFITDKDGHAHFANNSEEHSQNIKKYL